MRSLCVSQVIMLSALLSRTVNLQVPTTATINQVRIDEMKPIVYLNVERKNKH